MHQQTRQNQNDFNSNHGSAEVDDEDDVAEFLPRPSCKPDERTQWQHQFEWDDIVDNANRTVFKNDDFRENQREIINATKSKKDVLALIPTGGGKSLTF